MSINSAMLAGVTGLVSNSSALAAISDNISNANTVGYKRVGIDFSSLVNVGSGRSYAAGGVITSNHQFVTQQGTLQSSSSATDMAIQGQGFFVTTNKPTGLFPGDARYFTRAGSFTIDQNGYLQNAAGLYLQGWPADANGVVTPDSANLSSMQSINVLNVANSATATTKATVKGNLNSDQTINPAAYTIGDMADYAVAPTTGVKPDFSITVPVSDSKGGQRNFVVDFLRDGTTPNTWNVEVRADPPSDVNVANGLITSGTVTFDVNGKMTGLGGALGATNGLISLNASGGASPAWATALGVGQQSVGLDLSSLSQFSAVSSVTSVATNGTAFGSMAGLSIDGQGFVTAVYDNGTTRRIAQVAVATFPNADALKSVNGNAYQVSLDSGGFTLKEPGSAGAGVISPSSVEASTVDLSAEFTGLITTQRAYSASSKIITTADQMLQELLNIKQ